MAIALQKFSLCGPAGNLEGIAHVPGVPPRALALIAHPLPILGGTMENKVAVTLAKTFAEQGCVALRFNFRGVGGSEGKYDNGNGETEDLVAVAHFAQEQFGAELPLWLSGFSFGGYVAARAAERLNPPHLVLVAPAVGRFAMPAVSPNSLVIHGEQDEVVPLADVLNWARPQHLPIIVLPACGHFFHGRLTQLREIVQRHFSGAGVCS